MRNKLTLSTLALVFSAIGAFAQQPQLQYYRGWDKEAINIFEPSKKGEQPEYTGFKIRIGGAFTQDFQRYKNQNAAFYVPTSVNNPENKNFLYGSIKAEDSTSSVLSGFNLAMANLNFDMQIGDGIRVCLENYMSSRHHLEFWVKGGYIQIDKLPMFNNPQWFTDYVRVKIGHFQPNFGDMQFRRSDGGNTMFNPFVENGILDAFTTEIGGEVYVFPVDGFMVMGGMTSGFINGNILKTPDAVNSFGVVPTKRSPSLFGKVAYDKQLNDDLRLRLSASVYNNPNSSRNTLFAGDRTGSRYFGIMEPAKINGIPISIGTTPTNPAVQSGPNFTSGRFDPGFANRVTAISISPFIKFKGIEFFGSYDIANGAVYGDTLRGEWKNRSFNQLIAELVYRFLPNEQMYVGSRYIKVTGQPNGLRYSADDTGKTPGSQAEVGIDRLAFVAGWFPTKNLLLKFEYMIQNYTDFPKRDYRHEGKVSGFMIEAVIGF